MTVVAGIGEAGRNASLEQVLATALPPLSPRGAEVVRGLVAIRAARWNTDRIARHLGFANRHALSRLLAAEGVPPCGILIQWILVLDWVMEWEARRTPLLQQARSVSRWPQTLRRTVRARTGLDWAVVRDRGTMWVAAQLAEACVTPPGAAAKRSRHAPDAASLPLPSGLKAG